MVKFTLPMGIFPNLKFRTGLIGIPSMVAEKMLEVSDVFGTIKSLFMLIVTLFASR